MVSVGTIIWLSSELMFFAALFAAYFTIRAVSPELWAAETELLNVPFSSVNTLILVLSSVTCQLGVFAAERGQVGRSGSVFQVGKWGLREWFILTYVMGAVFIGGQALEYAELIEAGLTIPVLVRVGTYLRRPALHSRTSGHGDRGLLLLALRRRGVDRAVLHRLRPPVSLADATEAHPDSLATSKETKP